MRPFWLDVENKVQRATYEIQPAPGLAIRASHPHVSNNDQDRSRSTELLGKGRLHVHIQAISRKGDRIWRLGRDIGRFKPALRFSEAERRFAALAHNEQLLADNYQSNVSSAEQGRSNGVTLANEEEHVLRCLGAALIMQWNALPTKLQRELFDNAGSMGELMETAALRGQIARFLHRYKNDADPTAAIGTEAADGDASLHAASMARWDDEGGACQMPEQRGMEKRLREDCSCR
jgi:hypothetical protein